MNQSVKENLITLGEITDNEPVVLVSDDEPSDIESRTAWKQAKAVVAIYKEAKKIVDRIKWRHDSLEFSLGDYVY